MYSDSLVCFVVLVNYIELFRLDVTNFMNLNFFNLKLPLFRCRLTGALATACGDDGVRVFKEEVPASPDELVFSLVAQETKAHSQDVNCVSWNPKDAGLLASCSDNGEIAVWRFKDN